MRGSWHRIVRTGLVAALSLLPAISAPACPAGEAEPDPAAPREIRGTVVAFLDQGNAFVLATRPVTCDEIRQREPGSGGAGEVVVQVTPDTKLLKDPGHSGEATAAMHSDVRLCGELRVTAQGEPSRVVASEIYILTIPDQPTEAPGSQWHEGPPPRR